MKPLTLPTEADLAPELAMLDRDGGAIILAITPDGDGYRVQQAHYPPRLMNRLGAELARVFRCPHCCAPLKGQRQRQGGQA